MEWGKMHAVRQNACSEADADAPASMKHVCEVTKSVTVTQICFFKQ